MANKRQVSKIYNFFLTVADDVLTAGGAPQAGGGRADPSAARRGRAQGPAREALQAGDGARVVQARHRPSVAAVQQAALRAEERSRVI